MSNTLTLTCPHCGHTFERTYGVNVVGQTTLYCNCCGKARYVDLSLGWEPLPDCECGGSFDADAKGRCPKCDNVL